MIGRNAEIRSQGGIVYRGVIRAISDCGELGELFELGSDENSEYQRLVYVIDRRTQVLLVDDTGPR